MTRATHNAIHRIHRDREALRLVLQRRLTRVLRDMAGDAIRSDKPKLSVAANADLSGMIARQALLARLGGVRRSVLELKAGAGRDLTKRVNLSREADKEDKRDREYLIWLLAFLTPIVGQQAIASYRQQANAIGRRVAEQIKTPVMKNLAAALQPAAMATFKTDKLSDLTGDPFGTFGKADQAGSLVDEFTPVVDRVGRAREIRKAFDKSGVGKVSTRLIDTWAETVSYVEFESGRRDGDSLPAVSEMLYGYRWSSILDDRTTLGCKHLDGWVAPVGDKWMEALAPPRHFNCRSVLVPVWQSSTMKAPTPVPPKATESDLGRFLDQKLKYTGFLK